jgi:hypothetical protein
VDVIYEIVKTSRFEFSKRVVKEFVNKLEIPLLLPYNFNDQLIKCLVFNKNFDYTKYFIEYPSALYYKKNIQKFLFYAIYFEYFQLFNYLLNTYINYINIFKSIQDTIILNKLFLLKEIITKTNYKLEITNYYDNNFLQNITKSKYIDAIFKECRYDIIKYVYNIIKDVPTITTTKFMLFLEYSMKYEYIEIAKYIIEKSDLTSSLNTKIIYNKTFKYTTNIDILKLVLQLVPTYNVYELFDYAIKNNNDVFMMYFINKYGFIKKYIDPIIKLDSDKIFISFTLNPAKASILKSLPNLFEYNANAS